MKKEQSNPVKEWYGNIKNTKKNFKKVKGSPYASLVFALKVRKMILIPLMLFIAWKGYDIITNYNADGLMNTVGKIIMFAVFAYLLYRIYATIPAAKKQIEYYKKYPHVINYCPTDVKEDVDDILKKVKTNEKVQTKSDGGRKNVSEKKQNDEKERSISRETKTRTSRN